MNNMCSQKCANPPKSWGSQKLPMPTASEHAALRLAEEDVFSEESEEESEEESSEESSEEEEESPESSLPE